VEYQWEVDGQGLLEGVLGAQANARVLTRAVAPVQSIGTLLPYTVFTKEADRQAAYRIQQGSGA
jgi:hypothetical protein